MLFIFKYTTFFLENFRLLTLFFNINIEVPILNIVLPLAISFFTFQQIAFLVDTYRQKIDNNTFLDYCLFVSFFPQLIAGPIVHHSEMMPQFKNNNVSLQKAIKGIFIFSIGLFKKVYIADSFAKWADSGFKIVEGGGVLNIFESWVTSLSYTFQLYFDFSGYCDMAIGLGLLFGIMLPINFNSPYKALNITDFWRRWHITLGRFLKEYLYIPLGGNKLTFGRTLINLFIVAFLSGIWHGAGYGFVIWGALHGIAMVSHRIYSTIKKDFAFFNTLFYKALCWFITFNFLNISWIFFRSENVSGAINLLKGMFGVVWIGELSIDYMKLLVLVCGVLFVLCLKNSIEMLENFKDNKKSAIFSGILFYASVIYMGAVPYVKFIYFNF
ncbi:MBOAT family protein [Helicobacter sp. A82]|uniref:MBOAT family protein n=1 Tax=Helicobacter ibis TaxID=2962633 RepID=A0ABT4VD05_9HELI|nr:MBOAT family O-acyltransferase [Helicobacter ibis]MDA3968580.1 MBOAT family protein [Helicobacter ibis]